MLPIYIVGTLVAGFVWSAYDAHGKRQLNEHGEFFNEDTGTWQYPEPILPDIELNERGKGIMEWLKDSTDFTDEKNTFRNIAILAVILYTKPWK